MYVYICYIYSYSFKTFILGIWLLIMLYLYFVHSDVHIASLVLYFKIFIRPDSSHLVTEAGKRLKNKGLKEGICFWRFHSLT